MMDSLANVQKDAPDGFQRCSVTFSLGEMRVWQRVLLVITASVGLNNELMGVKNAIKENTITKTPRCFFCRSSQYLHERLKKEMMHHF